MDPLTTVSKTLDFAGKVLSEAGASLLTTNSVSNKVPLVLVPLSENAPVLPPNIDVTSPVPKIDGVSVLPLNGLFVTVPKVLNPSTNIDQTIRLVGYVGTWVSDCSHA